MFLTSSLLHSCLCFCIVSCLVDFGKGFKMLQKNQMVKPQILARTTLKSDALGDVITSAIVNVGLLKIIGALPITFAMSSKIRYGYMETSTVARRFTMMVNPFHSSPTNRTASFIDDSNYFDTIDGSGFDFRNSSTAAF